MGYLDIFKNRLGWEAEPGGGWAPIEENPPRSLPGRQIVSHLSSSLSKETNTNTNIISNTNTSLIQGFSSMDSVLLHYKIEILASLANVSKVIERDIY